MAGFTHTFIIISGGCEVKILGNAIIIIIIIIKIIKFALILPQLWRKTS